MPALARKLLVCAAVDGLILQPLSSRKDQRAPAAVKLKYGDASISRDVTASTSESLISKANDASFESFGVVGLITVSPHSYLITITRRQQVASIRGHPIYVVTEVALTPCTSQKEATEAISWTAAHLKQRKADLAGGASSDSDSDDDDPAASAAIEDDDDDDVGDNEDSVPGAKAPGPGGGAASAPTTAAEDVIGRRGSYGRFAQRWFSRGGWLLDQKRSMGLSNNPLPAATPPGSQETAAATRAAAEDASAGDAGSLPGASVATTSGGSGASTEQSTTTTAASLLPKLLRTTQILFGTSRSFFFSYDYDITRSIATAQTPTGSSHHHHPEQQQPLFRRVKPVFFWNRHVQQRFIDAGAEAFVLPLMQGFVGQRSFVVDSHPPQVDDGAKDSVELSDFTHKKPPGGVASGAGGVSSPTSGTASPNSERASEDHARVARSSERRFDITLISRRSVRRAGLRYLRRGVDDDGNTANFVETEQILSPSPAPAANPALGAGTGAAEAPPSSLPTARTYSFVQIRGSIPLFFKQTPYSLKPAPVIQHSRESNYQALKKHFDKLGRHYGSLQIVNLVEKHGIEAPLGEEYERGVSWLNEERAKTNAEDDDESKQAERIPFDWFDFHTACRGMKFENVSLLLDILGKKIESLGTTVAVVPENGSSNPTTTPTTTSTTAGFGLGQLGGSLSSPPSSLWSGSGSGSGSGPANNNLVVVARQKGVLRTNCMDCLDRTNVCQSSFAKLMLDLQLRAEGFDLSAQRDQETAWFNTLWADNGDSISKQYASTAAMKGDYTRTRKRDYRGALTDMGLSVTRFFSGMVNDFFVQTTIDFLLGNVTSLALEEFEVNMMTKDPAVSMAKLREQAIELCQKRVVADEREEFIGGWTMLTPSSPLTSANSPLTAVPLEEAVLLLTDVALYLCRFDWGLDKVSSFERVELAHVTRIRFGTYITATMSPTQMDPAKNQGILVVYRPGCNDVVRVNTRSMSSTLSAATATTSASSADGKQQQQQQAEFLPPPKKQQQQRPPLPPALSGLAGILLPHRPAAQQPAEKRIALKALYAQSSLSESSGNGGSGHNGGGGTGIITGSSSPSINNNGNSNSGVRLTEIQQVVSVTAQLERLVVLNQPISAGTQRRDVLEHGDVVSVAEAKRSTGLLEHLGHSIKKLVWA